jgi:hypothetical protein
MMRRQKNDGNHFPPNNKLVQEPEGNEEKDTQNQLQQNKEKLNQRTQ